MDINYKYKKFEIDFEKPFGQIQKNFLEDKYRSKNLRNIKSLNNINRKTSQEKNLKDKYISKNLRTKTPINTNRKTSQEKNLEDKYISKNLRIKTPININRKTSQEKNLEDKYVNKNLRIINYPIKNNNINRSVSQEVNNIIRRNSQIKLENKNIEKKILLLIIINPENINKNIIQLYKLYIEKECNINKRNNNQIEFMFLNYIKLYFKNI